MAASSPHHWSSSIPFALAIAAVAFALAVGSRASGGGPSSTEPQVTRLERALPGFVVLRSSRFVLVCDGTSDAAKDVLATMERTAEAVDAFAREFGLATRPLDRALVSVVFRDRAAFERFARTADNVDARWMNGYWLPGADRTVLRIGSPTHQLALRRAGATVLAGQAECDQAIVAHEVAHQVLHRLGLQRRSPGHPLWISEGLAVAFESAASEHSRGSLFMARPEVTARLLMAKRNGSLHPIELLISTPGLPVSDRTPASIRRFYDQAFSLTAFLAAERPRELAAYMRSLNEACGRLRPRRSIELFEASFGPLADVERSWHASLRARPRAG